MLDWILASIDQSRPHEVGFLLSWHGRFMVLAWGVLSPCAILIARFMKILPNQDWPNELDNRIWWKSHWIIQIFAVVLAILALILALRSNDNTGSATLHRTLGYVILAFAVSQCLSGLFRGSKGGPTAPANDGTWSGDHYDMTPWRLSFEKIHKSIGYLVLFTIVICILNGMWVANAPRWMFMGILGWWVVLLVVFLRLQSKGYAIETYQAIWGTDPQHPGNQMPPRGWKVRRPGDTATLNPKERS